jgi:hypothetical protein
MVRLVSQQLSVLTRELSLDLEEVRSVRLLCYKAPVDSEMFVLEVEDFGAVQIGEDWGC